MVLQMKSYMREPEEGTGSIVIVLIRGANSKEDTSLAFIITSVPTPQDHFERGAANSERPNYPR